MRSNGWVIDIQYYNQDLDPQCSTGSNFYGWNIQNNVGTLSATLSGQGTATLRFGNCWNAGTVKAYLNDALIDSASPNSQKTVQFSFTDGSSLKLKDENGNSVIQLNGIEFACEAAIPYDK